MLIDVHHHCLPPFVLDAFATAGRRPSLPNFPHWTPDLSLSLLDRFGIDRAIVSMAAPGAHLGQDSDAVRLARRFNDHCAELAAQSEHFGAFATLPLPYVAGALREIEHALDHLGLDGIGLFASYGERFLGDRHFEPVMAELDRRGAIVFVHPMGHPSSRALALTAPLWMLEYPVDTTRAALNLMLTGTLERFSRIRFILAHAGGTLPFLLPRFAGTADVDPRLPDFTAERVTACLRRFFYETAQSSGAATFAALGAVTGADHVLLGTDFPYCGEKAIAAMTENLVRLEGGVDALRAAGTALFAQASGERRRGAP